MDKILLAFAGIFAVLSLFMAYQAKQTKNKDTAAIYFLGIILFIFSLIIFFNALR